MDKKKALIRHEILNIFTLLNFEVSGADLDGTVKSDIHRQIKILVLLINYEDVLLGKKRKLLKRELDLGEVLETVAMIFETDMRNRGIKLTLPAKSMTLDADHKSIQEGLELILMKLMDGATKIGFDSGKKVVRISHNSKAELENEKAELINYLANRKDDLDFAYQLALKLLKLNGAKVKSGKGLLTITFGVNT